ncbi:MAG: urease accessory UreF family protein [Alphaproteobacteria bacterium]|jgi:urease accessory protein|nr:urease accessory UreF family protein [Alphaproteobacteria bacterium]
MTIKVMDTTMTIEAMHLLRLQSWLSPAFPIGAFSYSHGLEYAVEAGLVHDRASLTDWLGADLQHGSGRNEAVFLATALAAEDEAFLEAAELAAVSFASKELALEGLSQGEAFLLTVSRAWPHDALKTRQGLLERAGIAPTLAIAIAMACMAHGIEPATALHLYLQSWSANLINAAVRLVPLGQTDGQLAQAALEATVIATAQEAATATLDDLGSAAVMVDWASMQHENQYTRLFRS